MVFANFKSFLHLSPSPPASSIPTDGSCETSIPSLFISTTCPLDPIPSTMLQTISQDLLPFRATVILILNKPNQPPSTSFLCNQLSLCLSKNNLQDSNQTGFKMAHSTVIALLAVTEMLHSAKSAKLLSVFILHDLSAASDTVNHKTLVHTTKSAECRILKCVPVHVNASSR